jgi:hypothetical protein
MSEDISRPGGHHVRHAQLRNARRYYAFCRGCCSGVSLVAAAGDVRLDAAGDGPARECADAPGARDGAIGAGLWARALRAASSRTGGASPAARNLASRRSGSFFQKESQRGARLRFGGQDFRPSVSGGVDGQPSARTPGSETEGSNTMLALKYLLMILGVGLFGSAGALVVYDVYLSEQLRRLLARSKTSDSGAETGIKAHRPFGPVRWRVAQRLAIRRATHLAGAEYRGDSGRLRRGTHQADLGPAARHAVSRAAFRYTARR